MSNKAVKRLNNDYKYLIENPLAGTNAAPLEDNMLVWHCTTVVPEGSKYHQIPLHWVMEFPEDYPNKAPKAYFLTHLSYYGGAQARDDKGRTYLCLDLFGNFDHVHTEWKKTQGSGWSSSYTVSTILLQFQSALMDSQFLSTEARDVAQTKKESLSLRCSDCGHFGETPKTYFPQIPTEEDSLAAQMKNKASVSSPEAQFICYATQEKLADNHIFGYGVYQAKNKQGRIVAMTSPCEFLSAEAWKNGIRQSTQKKPLTHWIPIYINQNHWKQAEPIFEKCIREMATNKKDPFYLQVFSVLSSLMSGIVVDVMNTRSDTNASERFLEGYFACYRLLTLYRKQLESYADARITHFLANSKNRTKKAVPNLGEWLILLAVSSITWKDVAVAFQEECDTRNVFWYCVGNPRNPPKHPKLLNISINDSDRSSKVFGATQVSRNLVCFQTMFIRFVQQLDEKELDQRMGIPSEADKKSLKNSYDLITKMTSWDEYFSWNDLPPISKKERNDQLCNAVVLSEMAGYHSFK